AEDGIRDPLVTGVQTCALPIYPVRDVLPRIARIVAAVEPPMVLQEEALGARGMERDLVDTLAELRVLVGQEIGAHSLVRRAPRRSEERRVGKECRWRSEADPYI